VAGVCAAVMAAQPMKSMKNMKKARHRASLFRERQR